jgi:hypothetical protein
MRSMPRARASMRGMAASEGSWKGSLGSKKISGIMNADAKRPLMLADGSGKTRCV